MKASVVAVAFVAKKFVVVAEVKTAVEGTRAPIVVPFIVPPVTVRLGVVMFRAFTVVPVAVMNPSQEVLVTFVKEPFVEKRLVVVTAEPVPFVKVRF